MGTWRSPARRFKNRSPGAHCPRCGKGIEKVKVSGRSAYNCPRFQEKSKYNHQPG
ncbi:MAG: zinc finger domain-containing protein [Candidatus Bipolaricaulota bacterium]